MLYLVTTLFIVGSIWASMFFSIYAKPGRAEAGTVVYRGQMKERADLIGDTIDFLKFWQFANLFFSLTNTGTG